jgi:hypothetical protein
VPTAGSDLNPLDPKLVENFALFREELPGVDGSLSKVESEAVARMSAEGVRPDYAYAQAIRVVLDDGLTFLVIPGANGVLMFPPVSADGLFATVGAGTETLIKGLPAGSSGSLVFGLAPDGVRLGSVELADGSIAEVPVKRNVYAVRDPARS